MSEAEKQLQVGQLAEQYSELRRNLNYYAEKLAKAAEAFTAAADLLRQGKLSVYSGKLATPQEGRYQGGVRTEDILSSLMSGDELAQALAERERLQGEVGRMRERLQALVPYLL